MVNSFRISPEVFREAVRAFALPQAAHSPLDLAEFLAWVVLPMIDRFENWPGLQAVGSDPNERVVYQLWSGGRIELVGAGNADTLIEVVELWVRFFELESPS